MVKMEKRKVIGCILITIILFMLFVIFINHETIFSNRMTFNYPDGCIEEYINNKLITDECIEGRKLITQGSKQWLNNLNQT